MMQWLIRLYQILFSPDKSLLFSRWLRGRICRHHPHCSQYGYECFDHYPFFTACYRTMDRISRCTPGTTRSYDPVRYRTVFASGSPLWIPFLEQLVNDPRFDVVGILSMPDMPVGRGLKVQENIIAQRAKELGINESQIKKPQSLRLNSKKYRLDAQSTYQRLAEQEIDILYVIAYGHLIPIEILDLPKIAPINIHGSLLPAYRGASPLQQVFLDQRDQTGITLMKMEPGLDSGAMIDQQIFKLGFSDTVADLIQKIKAHTPKRSLDSIDDYAHGELHETPQDESLVSYCTKIIKEDGEIFAWPHAQNIHTLREIYAKYKAYILWPKIFCKLHTKTGIKTIIIEQLILDETIFASSQNQGLFIDDKYTLNPAIITLTIKPEGKKTMSWEDFLRGTSLIS